jgi:hypothetical protein
MLVSCFERYFLLRKKSPHPHSHTTTLLLPVGKISDPRKLCFESTKVVWDFRVYLFLTLQRCRFQILSNIPSQPPFLLTIPNDSCSAHAINTCNSLGKAASPSDLYFSAAQAPRERNPELGRQMPAAYSPIKSPSYRTCSESQAEGVLQTHSLRTQLQRLHSRHEWRRNQ